MHRYAARRISTPLDTRLVNRAESRDTTELSRKVIPLYPPSKGEHARSAELRGTSEVSRNIIPLNPPSKGETCPFSESRNLLFFYELYHTRFIVIINTKIVCSSG